MTEIGTKVRGRAILLMMIFSVLFLRGTPDAGSAPRRIEVVVTKQFGDLTAPAGKSFVLLYWEELNHSAAQSEAGVFLAGVSESGLVWHDLGRGSRVVAPVAGEEIYQGFYRYPAAVTLESAHTDFTNYTYHVGQSPESDFNVARVYPPAEHYHVNYQRNTKTCQACHSTHYARHPMLLNDTVMFNICIECHGDTGNFSKYNVLDGRVQVAPGVWVPSPAGAFASAGTTSFHNVFLEEFDSTVLFAPGGTGGEKNNLTCTDCHSAHVTPNSSFFRLLKFRTEPVVAYPYVSGDEYKVHYVDGMNSFCSNCHELYNYGDGTVYPEHLTRPAGGTGIQKSGDFYRHPTNINIAGLFDNYTMQRLTLPLEQRNSGQYMTCKTCHYAHGTSIIGDQVSPEGAQKYGFSGDRKVGPRTPQPQDKSSMLKRRHGMGICLECHLSQIWANTPYEFVD